MKNLAQICIAMAEAGIRLQTGDDLVTARTQHAAVVVEGRTVMQYVRAAAGPAGWESETAPASLTD